MWLGIVFGTRVVSELLIREINSARQEKAERDMPVEIFSIFWLLKKECIDEPEERANQMKGVLENILIGEEANIMRGKLNRNCTRS